MKAEKAQNNNADNDYIKGRIFMAQNKHQEAREWFDNACKKNNNDAVYWATLAIVYYNNSNYTESFNNIIKSTTLNPSISEIWYNLGILYEKCSQPEEAMIAYGKVLELDSDDRESQNRLLCIK